MFVSDRSSAGVTPTRIRVMIVEDHDMVSEAIAMALGQVDDVEVVGQASTLEQALTEAGRHRPDVVILDRRLPDGDAVGSIPRLQAADSATTPI